MSTPVPPVSSAAVEFSGVRLGDARLDRRIARIVERLGAEPSLSLPKIAVNDAELEGMYRFLENDRVSPAAILAPHRARTWERASAFKMLLSVEDTTEMRFGGSAPREGLGLLAKDGQGFYLHASLLVGLDDEGPLPLGLVEDLIVVRKQNREDPGNWKTTRRDSSREQVRWHQLAQSVDGSAREHDLSVVHVADREADDFDLMSSIRQRQGRFVIRLVKSRIVLEPTPPDFTPGRGHRNPLIDDVVYMATGSMEREVRLSVRPKARASRQHAAREMRVATLTFRALSLTLRPPKITDFPEPLAINLVEVEELDTPEGEAPIHWRLATTEPVATAEEVAAVVDAYRARWLIEEYWKALKTGCSMELRQLESLGALTRCLAILIPIAWQMLYLRHVARDRPQTPGAMVLAPRLYATLRFLLDDPRRNEWRIPLPKEPTAPDILYAIARIGGHLKRNGAPGWLTIRRGLDDLTKYARVLPGCDQ